MSLNMHHLWSLVVVATSFCVLCVSATNEQYRTNIRTRDYGNDRSDRPSLNSWFYMMGHPDKRSSPVKLLHGKKELESLAAYLKPYLVRASLSRPARSSEEEEDEEGKGESQTGKMLMTDFLLYLNLRDMGLLDECLALHSRRAVADISGRWKR